VAPSAGRGRRAVEVLLAGLLPVALAMLHPGLRDGIWHGLLALVRGDRWYSSIGEFRPLILGGREPVGTEIEEALAWYGLVPLVAAFGASVLHVRFRQAEERGAQSLLLLTWGATSFALALFQRRFCLYASAPLAIMAWTGVESARQRWVPGRCRPFILNGTVAVVLLGPVLSLAQAVLLKPAEVSPGPMLAWLAGQGDATPARAVYTRWSWGHHARALARRPALANPFGIEGGARVFEESLRTFLSLDEDEFLRVLERNHAGYLLNEDPHGELVYQDVRAPGTPALAQVRTGWRRGLEVVETEHSRRRIAYRLYSGDGSSTGELPALGSFRLLRETEPIDRKQSTRPGYALFGVVPGARLAVSGACPGEEIAATTVVRTNTGREFTWRATAWVGSSGTAVLRVPYATGRNGSSVARRFEIAACGETRLVNVPEIAVVAGAPVAVAFAGAPP
jgi:asparagine N-glycosylation enzyme membrane subunit Stt3